jgi:O-methyltransferase involved in polyketide biosynthesis
MALMRAMESRRADRLFEDPFAQAFVDASPEVVGAPTAAQQELVQAFALHASLRTRYFDDALLGAGKKQVVLVAAGLDTRAFRLSWPPGATVFELDLPDMLHFKQGVLGDAVPKAVRRTVPVDLTDQDWPDALVAAGFEPGESVAAGFGAGESVAAGFEPGESVAAGFGAGESTAWLVEGLLIYLTADEAARLLERIDALSCPGSVIFLEYVPKAQVLAETEHLSAMSEVSGLWRGGLDAPQDWLASRGWAVQEAQLVELARRYSRKIDTRVTNGGFISAVKKGAGST